MRGRTAEFVPLTRPKRFHVSTFLLLGVLYLGWYVSKRDDSVLLHLDGGRVFEERSDRFEGLPYFLRELVVTLAIVVVAAVVLSTSGG
ncbi:MAG: hypothetical protein K1X87_11625 [Dehalococcoidia bacterium]|nr:hypothetical protein [Dehalococcoidia bacterium]